MNNSKWDFRSAFSSKNILIPILQRDYVQGAKETVIAPFLDRLLESDCDLNYIYGYQEAGCFVPVDGQQRLITLWLLHLYVYCRKKNPETPFKVELKFQSREFASDFCSNLHENLRGLLLTPCDDITKEIQDQSWFISSWRKNKTVANMLKTLGYLHKKINDDNIDKIYRRFFESSCPVTFSFLEMGAENGLDDDIYIKMNGRGRPLSVFENLKSFMDKKVEKIQIPIDWKSSDWKGYMDNKWTDLFWENRNLTQEHPEEIDDEQIHMFCNLLILFHLKDPTSLFDVLSNTDFKEELIEYLDLGEGSFSDEQIFNRIIIKLSEGSMLPLVWLDRLKMMPDEFFDFAFNSLNKLSDRYEDINKSGLYFRGENDLITIYELSMTESSFDRTLPLLYSAISFRDGSKTSRYDWLRVTRNLIVDLARQDDEEKIETKIKILSNVINCIDYFSKKVQYKNIFDFLSEKTDSKERLKKVFREQQVDEEERKANSEMRPFHKEFARLENLEFFSGRISIIFKLLPEGGLNYECLHSTVDLLLNIFHGGKNGVTELFDCKNDYYLRRVLMSYEPYWFGFKEKENWTFCENQTEWRRYILDNKDNLDNENNLQAFISFVKEFAPKNLSEDELFDSIKEKVESISRNYLTDISKSDENTFRYYFIHHPEMWNFMVNKRAIRGKEPFNVFVRLKSQKGPGSDNRDLRAYALYLDYIKEPDLKDKYNGWNHGCDGRNAGFFFNRNLKSSGNKDYSIIIYVSFKGVDSENCYGIEVLLGQRDKQRQSDEQMGSCHSLFKKVKYHSNLFKKLNFVLNREIFSNSNLSRSEIINTINSWLSENWETQIPKLLRNM